MTLYPSAVWRILIDPPYPGALNMALDEAISEAVSRGDSPPTLRFYAWEPPCLSLGYAQPFSDVDADRLRARGWELVRRQTGGRAILHTDEVTYSVSAPASDPRLTGGVVESYRKLSAGLYAGLSALGAAIHAERAAEGSRGFKGAVCFEVPSDYEITADGRKLVGSAQTRRAEVILQHGTIPLGGDISRICDALAFPSEAERDIARGRVLARAATLESALGESLSFERVVEALIEGFSAALHLRLEPGTISAAEWARAESLSKTKYQSDEWNRKL